MVSDIIHTRELLAANIDPDYFFATVSYSSPKIESLQWDDCRAALTINFNGSLEELDSLVEHIKQKIGRIIARRQPRVVYSHEFDRPMKKSDVWAKLIQTGVIKDFGKGHVAYGGLFLELVEWFDAAFKKNACGIGANPIQLPNFLSLHYLKRVGSFEHYPHYLFFVNPLVSDIRKIEEFQEREVTEGIKTKDDFATPEYGLAMSACSLLYAALENTDFTRPTYYTMLGSCARHEAKAVQSFERLTEFSMREIVFIGNESGANEFRDFSLDLFRDVIECFNLAARISTASDSFFVPHYRKYKLMQLLGDEKFEVQLLIPDTQAVVAVGSFNHHRHFFSRRFNLSYDGEVAATACVGFGLERLVYGLLCQCGIERSRLLHLMDRFLEVRAAKETLPSKG